MCSIPKSLGSNRSYHLVTATQRCLRKLTDKQPFQLRVFYLRLEPCLFKSLALKAIQFRMFVLAEMTDTVRIDPWNFKMKLNDSIKIELHKKLANKVVHKVGLCIALHDIVKLNESHIIPGDGASHTKVHFRYVVFRPFLDEILVGRIRSCSREGVHVSMGFFDDILIPPGALQQMSRFDEAEQVWVWQYQSDEGMHDLFMDINEKIRFKVVDEVFVDTTPVGPEDLAEPSQDTLQENQPKKSPYSLVGSISEPGLGLLTWWT